MGRSSPFIKMGSPESAVADSSKPLQEILLKGVSDIRSLVTCKICTRFMYEPFTTKCGHTFCYACLSKWLGHGQRKRQCPDCRTRIKEEPCPNYTIRDIVSLLMSNAAFIDDEDTLEELQTEQRQEADILEKIRTDPNVPGLFQGLFSRIYHDPIEDATDGVMRCPRCAWEVEDYHCTNCDLLFEFNGDFLAEWSDEDEVDPEFDDLSQVGHLYEDDYDSEEPDEEDEAFIDDGEVEAGSMEGTITPTGDDILGISDNDTDISEEHLRDIIAAAGRRLQSADGSPDEVDGYHTSEDSEDSSQDSADLSAESDVESGDRSGSDDSQTESEEDDENDENNEEDDSESSAVDSDDEPIARQPRSQRRSAIPFRRAESPQRSNTRRPAPNVIDLTTPPTRNSYLTHGQLPTPSATGTNGMTNATGTTFPSHDSTRGRAVDADSGSESDVPIRPRRRKRERVVLSDSEDDDIVGASRDSRSQRRRLNQESSARSDYARNRQIFLAHAPSCRAN